MELISNYMRDEKSRHMLNELTQKTFGFDFEGWVTQGYFEGDYIPYSFVHEGKIVSNVSANRMQFLENGVRRDYIQLGTVMTDENFRKQGLAAKLIRHVLKEYEGKCDGIYLFGNLDALGFYRKQGFQTLNEYRYFVKEAYCTEKSGTGFKPVTELGEAYIGRYKETVRKSACQSAFEQVNKYGLQMFYTCWFDNVFYAPDIDCFVVLDQEDGTVLQSVICEKKIPLAEILKRLPLADGRCRLGFTPCKEDRDICVSELYDGADDYRLFYKGEKLEAVERECLYFPELSHA